jgi:hypothetical protein
MSPDASQHSLLRQALQQDWEDFYRRHALPLPASWDGAFEVPEAVYRGDWTGQLKVEALAARPCVLAHGLGQMMRTAQGLVAWPASTGQDWLAGLMNLQDDEQASAAVEGLIRQLLGWAQAHRPTPRPTASVQAPEVIRTSQMASPAVDRAGANSGAGARFAANGTRVDAQAPTPGNARAGDGLEQPQPASQAVVPAGEPAPPPLPQSASGRSGSGRKSRAWLPPVSGAAIVAAGWALLDMIYTAAQASSGGASARLTVLGLSGVGFAVLASAICLAGVLFAQDRLVWWRRGIYANALGQGVLVTELWVQQMPVQVLWFAAACPLIALFSALVGAIGSKNSPS